MQAFKIFFMQAIKKKIVYTSTFWGLCKPLACLNHTWNKNTNNIKKNNYYFFSYGADNIPSLIILYIKKYYSWHNLMSFQ